jgi:hypothetical protein
VLLFTDSFGVLTLAAGVDVVGDELAVAGEIKVTRVLLNCPINPERAG